MIKDFYTRVKNLVVKTVRYAVFCWKNGGDHDWDFAYLYYILQWKLDNMAACIKKNDVTTKTNVMVRQIKYASYLIDRINSDYDYDKLMEPHKEKWGGLNMVFENIEGSTSLVRSVFTWENAKGKDEDEIASREGHVILIKSNDKKLELKSRLFKHLDKYIENWWD